MSKYVRSLHQKMIPIKLKVPDTCGACPLKYMTYETGTSGEPRKSKWVCRIFFGQAVCTDGDDNTPLLECLANRFEIEGEEREYIYDETWVRQEDDKIERKLVYLATPYSHPNPEVCEKRFREANRTAGLMMCKGIHVFSPVSHLHPIAKEGKLPEDWAYWKAYCTAMLRVCGKMVVLMQDGWTESTGVRSEIEIATELGIPVEYDLPERSK